MTVPIRCGSSDDPASDVGRCNPTAATATSNSEETETWESSGSSQGRHRGRVREAAGEDTLCLHRLKKEQFWFNQGLSCKATLALGSSNSDQPLSKVTTLATKLAKPLGMAPPSLFLDPVSPIRINPHFVLCILVFCVN